MPLYTQFVRGECRSAFPAGQEEGSTPMVCVDRDRDIPLPIVQLNRWVLVVGVVGGLILRQPLLTTALFLVVVSAVLFGRRGSLIFQAGRLLLAKRNAKALSAGEVEDPRLMRFNNTLAAMLLGGAQLAFLLGLEERQLCPTEQHRCERDRKS